MVIRMMSANSRSSADADESLEASTRNLNVASPPADIAGAAAAASSTSLSSLRRVRKSASASCPPHPAAALRNTRAEFRRLKTILPSIQEKDNVSRLDIILEAIKYIDSLQDQLIDRLSGPKDRRERELQQLTERDMEKRLRAQNNGANATNANDAGSVFSDAEEEDAEEDDMLEDVVFPVSEEVMEEEDGEGEDLESSGSASADTSL